MTLLTSLRWRLRVGALVVVWVAVLVGGGLLGFDPHPWRALLVCAGVVALTALAADTVVDPAPPWHREHPERDDWPARDPRTAFYTRLVDSHLTARTGNAVVQDRLLALARDTYRSRHGEELDARELDELAAVAPSRMTSREIAGWLDWIEAL